MPTLTTRSGKGSPLTQSEMDENLTDIQAALNYLATTLGWTIKENGIPKYFCRDVGTQDAYAIVPDGYLTGYVDGLIYAVLASSSNSGDCTLCVCNGNNGVNTYLDPVPLRLNGAALPPYTIVSGGLFLAVYDATAKVFNIVGGGGGSGGSSSDGGNNSSGNSTGTNFQTYNPPDAALAAVVGTVHTFTYGLNAIPTSFRVDLICIADNVGYTAGQAVASTSFTNSAGTIPAFAVQINQSSQSIIVTETLASIYTANPNTGAIAAITNNCWRIRVSACFATLTGSYTTDPNNPLALPGTAGASVLVNHGLGVIPNTTIGLVCQSAELGYAAGAYIPIQSVFDSTGTKQAFTAITDTMNIKIVQNVNAPYVWSLTDNMLKPITQSNWSISVLAFNPTKTSSTVTPALEIQTANPLGAICYGTNLFLFHYCRFAAKTLLSKIDLTTNNVTFLQTFTGSAMPTCTNLTLMRFADGIDRLVWGSNCGLGSLKLDDPGNASAVTRYGSDASTHPYKPVWVDQSLNQATPNFYIVASAYYTDANGSPVNHTISDVLMRQVVYTSNYAAAASISPNPKLNLLKASPAGNDFTKFHQSGNSLVMLFQYNPITKRIYVMTNECGYLHIFNINAYTASNNIVSWWKQDDATRYSQLVYEKTIAIGGGGASWTNTPHEHIAIEFDLTSGLEQSITFTRTDSATLTGTVTCVPWRE